MVAFSTKRMIIPEDLARELQHTPVPGIDTAIISRSGAASGFFESPNTANPDVVHGVLPTR